VADRGINQFVTEDYWQQLCGKVTHLLAAEQYVQAIAYAVQEMGTTLQRFYAMQAKDDANELADAAIFL
jgi:uncharacterized membrane protein